MVEATRTTPPAAHIYARLSALAGRDAMLHQGQIGQDQERQGQLHQVSLDRFEEWFIRRTARELVGQAGFMAADVEDIEQDFRLDVLQRLASFDAAKSNRHTFVVMVVRRCAATMLERQRAEKRDSGRRVRSLSEPVRDTRWREYCELGDTLVVGACRLGRDSTSGTRDEERRDLVADVRRVVASLPAEMQPWCAVLGGFGIREASRVLGFPRSRLCRIVDQIRAAFEQAGLGEYLAPA